MTLPQFIYLHSISKENGQFCSKYFPIQGTIKYLTELKQGKLNGKYEQFALYHLLGQIHDFKSGMTTEAVIDGKDTQYSYRIFTTLMSVFRPSIHHNHITIETECSPQSYQFWSRMFTLIISVVRQNVHHNYMSIPTEYSPQSNQ